MVALRLIPDAGSFGQCEANRECNYHNDTPKTNRQCCFSARFEVNGKLLCSKHAGVAALKILLGEQP